MWGGTAGIIAVLVIVEGLEVGLNTLTKAAMARGMSDFVFIVYSNVLALFFLLPLTFIFHRIRPCPQLTFSILCKIFVLGLLSSSLQMCMYIGIGYSSPALASVMIDITPAFTFLLAIITRMEKLDLKVQSSQAKFSGTIILITGAFIVTCYEGPPIIISPSLSNLLHEPHMSPQSNWIIGGFLLATASFLLAVLLIFQTHIINEYPAELMVTLICCSFVTIQSSIVALIAERDSNAWKLRPDLELVAIIYSAILVVSLRSVVQVWALHKKGPVFVTMFKPLGIVIAVVMGITFLGDTLHIGKLTSPPPKMTFSMVWRMLVLGLVSSSMQVFIFIGINYGSPTLASAMTNLTPAYTFILALLFRMERLDLKVKSSQAKFMGTIVSIVGAFIVTLYKGSAIIFTSTPSNLIHEFLTSPQSSWIIGGFFLPVANFFKSLMYIVQTWIIKDYPAELMLTLCSVIFMSLMPAIVCVIAERDQSAWELRPGTELVAIGYSAIYGVSLRNAIHILALRLKGPMFVTMFKPLGIVIAVIMGIIFLGDTLHLGSVIGAVIIARIFYSVMWGKAKGEESVEDSVISGFDSSYDEVPHLQHKRVEI